MKLEKLGWDSEWEARFSPFHEKGLAPGRVAVEDKHHYIALTSQGHLTAQVAGKVLHNAESTAALPKVGDWVALTPLPNEDKGVIHHVLPRKTKLSRKLPGREVEEQMLVANIDLVFIVQPLDREYNPRLVERHLIMVHEGGAQPVVVLNKTDLCPNLAQRLDDARGAAGDAPVVAASAKLGEGIEELQRFIKPGTTVVFVGASGVGKSSLINALYGDEVQATAEVRESDAKGRHMTTWREMIILPNGGLVIDTPGMREFQMWLADEGVQGTFTDIEEVGTRCHFRNCSHTVEKKCAVLAAVESGEITQERYNNYLKLRRELEFLEQAHTRHGYLERRRRTRVAQRAFEKFKRDEH
ncbi:MAG: ribosome small subunit-dependent GTPase A [Verrucomicrobiota bacterium]